MAEGDGTEPGVLKGEDALALARQGMDAWNEWAVDNVGCDVKFDGVDFADPANANIDFSGCRFPGAVSFGNAKFSGKVRFGFTIFSHEANFESATFSDHAVFVSRGELAPRPRSS